MDLFVVVVLHLLLFFSDCKLQNIRAKSATPLRCSSARGFLEESDDEINGKEFLLIGYKRLALPSSFKITTSFINNLIP